MRVEEPIKAVSVPGYTFLSRAPRSYKHSWGKEKPSSKNYNRHPSYFWVEGQRWIDRKICPLLPVFNTKNFETGATCQGGRKSCGEFWIYYKNDLGQQQMFNLARWIIDKMQPLFVKSKGFYPGFDMYLKMRSKNRQSIVLYMEPWVLQEFTKIFLGATLPDNF